MIDQQKVQTILALHSDGMTTQRISKSTGVAYATVRKTLHTHGLQRNCVVAPIVTYVQDHYKLQTPQEMAQQLGVHPCKIYHAMTVAGIPARKFSKFHGNEIVREGGEGGVVRIFLKNANAWCIIDESDYEKVKDIRWMAYRSKKDTTTYVRNSDAGFIHRYIMEPPDDMVINHLDWNGLNNTRKNLEVTTQKRNAGYRDPARLARKRAIATDIADAKQREWKEHLKKKFLHKLEHCPSYGLSRQGNYFLATKRMGGIDHYIGTFQTQEAAHEAFKKFCTDHLDQLLAEIETRSPTLGFREVHEAHIKASHERSVATFKDRLYNDLTYCVKKVGNSYVATKIVRMKMRYIGSYRSPEEAKKGVIKFCEENMEDIMKGILRIKPKKVVEVVFCSGG